MARRWFSTVTMQTGQATDVDGGTVEVVTKRERRQGVAAREAEGGVDRGL